MKLLVILLAFVFILETLADSNSHLLFFKKTSNVTLKITYDTNVTRDISREITVPIKYFVGKPWELKDGVNPVATYEIKCLTDGLMKNEILPRIDHEGKNGCQIKSVIIVSVKAKNGKHHDKYIDMTYQFSEYIK